MHKRKDQALIKKYTEPKGAVFIKKCINVKITAVILAAVLLLCGCSALFTDRNIPYEPESPTPAPHDGIFISEHGRMEFNGDGTSICIEFDDLLSELTGLEAGRHEGSYVFLSGDLPPSGNVPVRYDTAHILQISCKEQSAMIDVGIADVNGSGASIGTGIVTAESIPLLFNDGKQYMTIAFDKDKSNADKGE